MILVVAACAETAADATDTADTAGTADSSAPFGWGPTAGPLDVGLSVDAELAKTARLKSFSLAGSLGTLRLDGVDHHGIVYLDHDWPESGYHLYDVFSVADDGSALAITYLYEADGNIPYAYTESYGLPMDWEATSGTLLATPAATPLNVELPALTTSPPAFDVGISIDGADAHLDATGGDLTLAGVNRDVHPFGAVDCTDCPGGPWLEIHAVLSNDDDACFAILYLYPDDPSVVHVEHGLCVPTLERLRGAVAASWSGTLTMPNARRADAPIRGVPPSR